MTQLEILKEIKKFNTSERLSFIEATLRMIREELQTHPELEHQQRSTCDRKQSLQEAAKALLPDYLSDSELTSFTLNTIQ